MQYSNDDNYSILQTFGAQFDGLDISGSGFACEQVRALHRLQQAQTAGGENEGVTMCPCCSLETVRASDGPWTHSGSTWRAECRQSSMSLPLSLPSPTSLCCGATKL